MAYTTVARVRTVTGWTTSDIDDTEMGNLITEAEIYIDAMGLTSGSAVLGTL